MNKLIIYEKKMSQLLKDNNFFNIIEKKINEIRNENPNLNVSFYWENSDVLSIDLKNFEKQMKYMKSNNFKTISFDDLNKEFKDEKNFIITFDDGYENVY